MVDKMKAETRSGCMLKIEKTWWGEFKNTSGIVGARISFGKCVSNVGTFFDCKTSRAQFAKGECRKLRSLPMCHHMQRDATHKSRKVLHLSSPCNVLWTEWASDSSETPCGTKQTSAYDCIFAGIFDRTLYFRMFKFNCQFFSELFSHVQLSVFEGTFARKPRFRIFIFQGGLAGKLCFHIFIFELLRTFARKPRFRIFIC